MILDSAAGTHRGSPLERPGPVKKQPPILGPIVKNRDTIKTSCELSGTHLINQIWFGMVWYDLVLHGIVCGYWLYVLA